MIEKERIEAIKNGIDLKTYIEERGISLKKNGKGYIGLCPFHDEKKPSFSVTPEKQIFHCFGCGKSGNVIQFVMYRDNIGFVEAFEKLERGSVKLKGESLSEKTKKPVKPPEPKIRQHLERVSAIYGKNLAGKGIGRKYLEKRGITDAGLFTKHRIGFCDGNLKEILPSNGSIRDELNHMGILLDNDYERFKDCIVLPVYDVQGNIVTLYGRHIMEGEKHHLYLQGRSKGIWNVGIIKTYPEIIITESILDALSVEMAGFGNVISIQGASLADRDIMMFKEYGVHKLVLLLDGDEPGKKAVLSLKEKLSKFSLVVKELPDSHDPNSYLKMHGPQKLAEFIKADTRTTAPEPSDACEDAQTQPDGITVRYGLRQYQIMGLEKGPRKLKATVRIEHAGKLHVDTLDFYSARARRTLAQDVCRIFEEVPETIESDITRLILECEKTADKAGSKDGDQTPDIPQMTDKERKAADAFGRSPDLINQILGDYETCGIVGEEANKLLGYIAMTSRKRKRPLAVLILACSGSGKTTVQDASVEFCPPEDRVKLTSLSGKALFYKERMSLKHKVLALEEGDGAEEAAYAIRNLISSGVLITETTIKDLSSGRLTTMENKVEGPTAVFYTTTNPNVDPETKSRFFVTGIDESRAQTRQIQAFQRERHMEDDLFEDIEINVVKKRHWNFQRRLKPLGVKNPYSHLLSYGDDRLQGRRDQPKYLNLIKSIAFLRQMQKSLKYEQKNGNAIPYIEVDAQDIEIANKLTHEILGRSLDELSRPGRDLLLLLDDMVERLFQEAMEKNNKLKRTDICFSRRDIREFTGWTNSRVHRHLKELVDLEYVLVESGRNGSIYRYHLAYEGQGKKGEKFMLGLKSVAELKKAAK